jgi:chaperonin cofactor prefoldin
MEKDHLEILLENINEKFDLVLEGHAGIHHEIKDMRQDMNERFELVDFKIDALNQKIDGVDKKLSNKIDGVDKKLSNKIDAMEKSLKQEIRTVADDLAAHRADTESHRKGYKVSDG